MVGLDTFEQFLATNPVQISLGYLVFSLVAVAILSLILRKIYVKYGTSLSNRKSFSGNFMLLSTTTTLIIMVVKSSLALSLGLVGALSIVRFRAAIKEPEELAYLFLCIAIGLGFGAGQVMVTVVSFVVISLIIWARHFLKKAEEHQNLYLTVSGGGISLKEVVEVLKKNAISVHLKRFDQSKGNDLDASFLVDFKNLESLEKIRKELTGISKSLSVSYLDKSGLY
jgi:hypothetical protein